MASQPTPDPLESAVPEEAAALEQQPEAELSEAAEEYAYEADEPEDAYLLEDELGVSAPRGGFMTFVLGATGFCMAAGGIALATAPYFSWQLEKIGRELSGMGMESGTFMVGGLLLFSLSIVFRAVHSSGRAVSKPESAGQDELALVVEELATDLSMFRQSILQVANQVAQLGQHQSAVYEELRAQKANEQTSATEEPSSSGQPEAMFRLAASLDQLNARVDERMHHMDVQLRGHFEGVGEAIRENREAMDARMRTIFTQMQAHLVPTSAPAHSDAPSLTELAHHEAEFGMESETPEAEDLHVVVDLEEMEAEEPDEAAIEFFETIGDLNEMVSGQSEDPPPPLSPALDLDGLDLGELGLEEEPPAVRPDPEPAPPAASEDALEALLPDENIQRALDPERRDPQ